MNYDRELKYRRAFAIWSMEHPNKNINDVSRGEVVLVDGESVKLGSRIHNMREILKGNAKGNIDDEQYRHWVVSCGLSTDNKDIKSRKTKEEKYREALEIWLKNNVGKNVNDVTNNTEVKISSGEIIKLGIRIKSLKAVFLGNRSGKITPDQYNYWITKQGLLAGYDICYDEQEEKIIKTKKEIDRSINTKKIRDERQSKKKTLADLSNIKNYFDVDEERLRGYSTSRKSRQSSSNDIMKIGDESLRNYCARNGYNYDVVYRKIKNLMEHGYRKEEAMIISINSYEQKGVKKTNGFIYSMNNQLAKYVFLYLGLNGDAILREMNNYNIGLERAIRHNLFHINVLKKNDKWLEGPYNELIALLNKDKPASVLEQELIQRFYEMVQELELDSREYNILWRVFNMYVVVIKNYYGLDVGLTEDSKLRDAKVKMYNFSDEDLRASLEMAQDFKKKFGFDVSKKRK